ncbi:hypothetical protein GCM10027168_68790 [Streptomyces capparidis]
MPDDVGGSAFPEGDHGGADDEFASVVFDEAFIRSAPVHEPSAQERLLAAAQARAEAEQTRTRLTGRDDEGPDGGHIPGHPDDEYGHDWDHEYYDERQSAQMYRRHVRWHRTVAWVLAVVMGVGVLALTVAAVYRGASGGRPEPAPPPNSRIDPPGGRDGAPPSPGLPSAVHSAVPGS